MPMKLSLLATARTLGGLLLIAPINCSHPQQSEVHSLTMQETQHAATAEAPLNRAILEWEQAATIQVAPEAKAKIVRDISGSLGTGTSQKTKAFIAKAYLYELRDLQSGESGYPRIMASDLQAIPLDNYVREAALGKKVGYLRCISVPEGGKITIDDHPRGQTIREFVLSIGKHDVAIDLVGKRCEKRVDIKEEQLAEARCPMR